MVKTLVLVRHGKTEDVSETGLDVDRKLTASGIRALEVSFPRTFALLGDEPEVAIWSSPAVRALQTAGVVAEAVDAGSIDVHQSLYDQDVDAVIAELTEQIPTLDCGVLVLVGHVPFMNELSMRLTDVELRFSKGAAAAIALDEGKPTEKGCTLRWFVAGPAAFSWDAMAIVEDQVQELAVCLSDALDDFLAEPDDPEALRDFRVNLRRLRSVLTFLTPWLAKKQVRRNTEDLRGLLDATTRLREIDILSATVDGLVEAGELGDNSLLPVACAKERQIELEGVLALMKKRHVKRDLHSLADEVPTVRWKGRALDFGLGAENFQAHFDEELEGADGVLFGLDLHDPQSVHDARSNAKDLHFVASRLAAVLGDERSQASEYFDNIQGELGALCDAQRNERLANEYSTSPRFRGVRADLGVVARDQAEVASAILAGSTFSAAMRTSE